MRPIDADALVDMLQLLEDKLDKKAFREIDLEAAYISGVVQEIKERVINASTIDYAPVKRGEWIEPVQGYKTCSECGEEHPNVDMRGFYVQDSFCPNCGAEMCGKDDGNEKM